MSDNEVDATLLGRTNRDVMSRPTWIIINDNPTTKLFPESLSRSAYRCIVVFPSTALYIG